MPFDVQNKVAIITGAASGLGFFHAKELLSNGLRNVTVVDVNEEAGRKAVKELCDEYGIDKAIFVKADVSNEQEFERAFKETISRFKNIDILINNAAIIDERNWSKVIDVNLKSVIGGILLAFDYISIYKTGDNGLVVNTSSIGCLGIYPGIPFYSATKKAILMVSRSLGDAVHYNRTKVQVVAICPGLTNTSLAHEGLKKMYNKEFQNIQDKQLAEIKFPMQEPIHVSKSLMNVIKKSTTGSVWVIDNGEAYELEFPAIYATKKQ